MPNKRKIIAALLLIIFGVLSRILLRDIPNVETVTITALLGGSFLGGLYAIVIPLAVIALSDIWIGNNAVLIFTWSAWAVIGLFGLLAKKDKKDTFRYSLKLTGLGIAASLFFYLWTNFGWWLITPEMYPTTFSGLIRCYIMGLPFLKYNLIGNLIIIPIVATSLVTIVKWHKANKILVKLIHRFNAKM